MCNTDVKLDIGTELFSRTGASQPDTDPCAIQTGRLVGQYSGSSRVHRFYRVTKAGHIVSSRVQ